MIHIQELRLLSGKSGSCSDGVSVIEVLFLLTSYSLIPVLLTVEQKYKNKQHIFLLFSSTYKVVKRHAFWLSNCNRYGKQEHDVPEHSEYAYVYIFTYIFLLEDTLLPKRKASYGGKKRLLQFLYENTYRSRFCSLHKIVLKTLKTQYKNAISFGKVF